MIRWALAAVALMGVTSPARANQTEELILVCDGGTLANMPTSETEAAAADRQGNAVAGYARKSGPVFMEFSVQLRIHKGGAEMNLPPIATPEWNSGKVGWHPVRDLVMGDDEITGRVRFNFLNSSKFTIDRRTGSITTSGGFRGTCHKRDLTQRAF